MWMSLPSPLSIGKPAARTAASASVGAAHGGLVSRPTPVVAGGSFNPRVSACAVCDGIDYITATATTTAGATATTAAAASHHDLTGPLRARAMTRRFAALC